MEDIKNKTIFISALDWGLGHSTRCLSIITRLKKNNKIIIGVSDLNAFFFEKHCPELKKIPVPSYNICYSKYLPVWLKIILQSSKIKSVIKEENTLLEQIVKLHKIDLVISDNRFGLYNNNVECVFITHQLKIKSPFFSSLATKVNQKYIHNFSEVWVPDFEKEEERLAGVLSDSKGIKIPVKYIGPQSALSGLQTSLSNTEKFDFLILLSGVEPQRTILENILIQKFEKSERRIIFVRGSDLKIEVKNKNISLINFAFGSELKTIISNADTIMCRSGYSTLMDLFLLGKKKLILIPTPGQTEQEYLADYWKNKFGVKMCEQKRIAEYYFKS